MFICSDTLTCSECEYDLRKVGTEAPSGNMGRPVEAVCRKPCGGCCWGCAGCRLRGGTAGCWRAEAVGDWGPSKARGEVNAGRRGINLGVLRSVGGWQLSVGGWHWAVGGWRFFAEGSAGVQQGWQRPELMDSKSVFNALG